MQKPNLTFISKPEFWLAILAGPAVMYAWSLLQPMPAQYQQAFNFQALAFLNLVILYPSLEEYVFRGMLQTYLLQKFSYRKSGLSVANLLTSLAFSLAHLIFRSYMSALLVFWPSLVFGYFRERYHSIIPAVILHSFYNFCVIVTFPQIQ